MMDGKPNVYVAAIPIPSIRAIDIHAHNLSWLADILNLLHSAFSRPKIQFESSIEELQKHFETNPWNGWVVAAFAEFISYECVYTLYTISRGLVSGFR